MTATKDIDHKWSWIAGGSLTEAKWKKIKTSLELVKVNADKIVIAGISREWSLRAWLPFMARISSMSVPKGKPTPRQLAGRQSQTIKLCNELLNWLDDPHNFVKHRRIYPSVTRSARRVQEDLKTFIGELECHHHRTQLEAMGGSRGKHNATAHNMFWKELLPIWEANVDQKIRWRKKRLRSFLFACSEPFFPEETSDKAVETFVQRHISRK